MTYERTVEGGCLCGRLRYRITGPLDRAAHCHCSMCRLGSGAPVVSWTVVRPHQFAWLTDAPAVYASSAGCARTFCPECGTKLTFTDAKRPDDVDVTLGSLDAPGAVDTESQIFGRSKVGWLAIDPQAPFRSGHEPVARPAGAVGPVGSDHALEGGCLCGAVRYAVTGPPERSAICHCGICRRETGGPFVAWGIWPRERFCELAGATVGYVTSDAGIRRFCATCGATVYFESRRNPAIAEIMLAGLDAPDAVDPPVHAFAAHAVPGLVLDDDRPRWPHKIGDGAPDPSLLRRV